MLYYPVLCVLGCVELRVVCFTWMSRLVVMVAALVVPHAVDYTAVIDPLPIIAAVPLQGVAKAEDFN